MKLGKVAIMDTQELRHRLRHIFWIGGGSGAGKSTIARQLAKRHGWRVYDSDAAMHDHAQRLAPQESPFLQRFTAMDMDERWVDRSPEEMLDTFHWYRGEGFGLIVEDLLSQPAAPCVVEGFRLVPHLVKPLLAEPDHAVWLLPSPQFRDAAFRGRKLVTEGFIAKTKDPERAYRNLVQRDAMFTDRLRGQTNFLALHSIEVALWLTVDELNGQVEEVFGMTTRRSCS